MSEPSYEEVAYEGRPVPATAPAALALTARVHGGPRPSPRSARVLELGCGDGANLLPLAFFHRDWELVGVDSSPRAIATANEGARALGLRNVRFVEGDLADLALEGEHDFVIAHGVYSWIDAEHRAALRALVRRSLAPSGLAYVSFNAMPAWGVRARVRDALTRWPAGLEGARARAAGLAAMLAEPQHDWAVLLSHELSRVTDASDAYLAHEYLARDNDAFWLGEVVLDFAAHGMRYVGDACFDRPEGFVHPSLRERVASLADDPIAREELVDLLAYRQLRAAVFCRDDAELEPPAGRAIIEQAFIASAVRATSDPFDPSPGVEEPFVGPRGTEVRVSSALAKMALLVLASSYPRGLSLDVLVRTASDLLRRHGITPEPDERARLSDGLYALYAEIELELRLEDPPLHVEPSDQPVASVLTRYEASCRPVLTTPVHGALPLEPIDRAIIERLDGSRSAADVASSIVEAIEQGSLALEGAPSGAARVRSFVEARVPQTITTLGWWGLAR